MTKQRHCFVAQVGDAIEALASALDPEREPPFKGDILDLLEWAERDVLEMRQQLATALAACSLKDEYLLSAKLMIGHPDNVAIIECGLAIQPDDSALKAWLGEPVAFKYQNRNTEHVYLTWKQSPGGRNWTPLYAPKGMI